MHQKLVRLLDARGAVSAYDDFHVAPAGEASAIAAEKLIDEYRRDCGCAVLLVTHDLSQARRMADEALFFFQGELWEHGSAEKVLRSPEKEETRRFLEFYGGR